jgi:eukaryotic-like serine/threonine-protein kinase
MDALAGRLYAPCMNQGDWVADRFEIHRRVGSGGMGEVFRALDRTTGGAVALKIMMPGGSADQARFEREALSLMGLRHPRHECMLDRMVRTSVE